jgi:murein L,D-transpeptidase YcbB/YkuD
VSLLTVGCDDWKAKQKETITMEAFSELRTPTFFLDQQVIRKNLLDFANADHDGFEADKQTRNYYRSEGSSFVWLKRTGIDERADSLLAWLHQVNELGMSEKAFTVSVIEKDLERLRTLDFDEKNNINTVAARLEFLLTKACLRYSYGQRYGFVNPYQLFNNLDAERQDTLGNVLKYRGLFDVKMDLPDAHYAHTVLQKVKADSLSDFLQTIQPKDRFYLQLKDMLANASTQEQKKRVMVNMERSRWRRHQPIEEHAKRIVVNIPAYHLYAYSPDSMLDMRVVCGTVRTKTPQLSSNIEWMEVNPQWVIPMSIVEADVARRAGDSSYFARNRYAIYDRSTNKKLGVHEVSRQMLLSGRYRVAQEGGAGNSLGRIVFRFKNNFSVFLHDTSNPGAFQRESRAVSHGCVRVSKPYELARFVLDNPDEWLLDRIAISMGLPPQTDRGREYVESHPNQMHKLIGYVPVKPRVPLYIIYYTLWPDASGILQTWPDVYGYDEVIWRHLQHYI